jgi:hypothetical protein
VTCESCERKDALISHLQTMLLDKADRIAELEKALHQHGHMVTFREDDFFTEHPIECRSDKGIHCQVDAALHELPGPPLPLGTYPVALDEDGELVFNVPGETVVTGSPV